MKFFGTASAGIKYHKIEGSISSDASDDEEPQSLPRHIKSRRTLITTLFIVILIIVLLLAIPVVLGASGLGSRVERRPKFSSNISIRREWRSLSDGEKLEYISAVQCLRGKPSRIGRNHTLYDDFPWVHSQIGEYSHKSAAFLAWHRYFLAIYEKTLRTDCGLKGSLPYWDWTLDWEDPTKAPVWDTSLGFGGTGDPNLADSFLNGTCVTTGPFANVEVLYVKGKVAKHCLSRGFLKPDDPLMSEYNQFIQPARIFELLKNNDYETFNLDLEETSHAAIPRIVRGDFLLFTVPFDPVFFLHHAQLDRIWFKWQQMSEHRKQQYRGAPGHEIPGEASLQDKILMGGLAPDLPVSTIMDTRSEALGYVYW